MLRSVSAAVLAPLVLAIAYAGGWLFVLLCALAASGVLWEWTSLVAHRVDARVLVPGLLAVWLSALVIGLHLNSDAWAVMIIGAMLTGLIEAGGRRSEPTPIWAAGGVVYAGLVLLGAAMLRADAQWGLTALLFLFATVWSTDIFAYFCGRAIGGPLLWRKVSPKKTWSGAIGGLAGGVAAGIAVAYASGVGKLGIIGIMAFLLSILSQIGDLFESAIKRRFGVKDAGALIPGHGGLMDRLDGFVIAAFAALLIGLFRQGAAAPARGLLIW
jgi:phosphatidate cytidylyltransferase